MAAPSYVQASTGSTDAGGAWTATGAAGTSGNIVILQVLQDGSTSGAVTLTSATNIENLAGTDNAWTSIGSFAVGSPTSAYQHIWIGRLINTSAPTASGGNSTSEDLYWRFMEVSNVNTGTTLASVIENGAGAIATETWSASSPPTVAFTCGGECAALAHWTSSTATAVSATQKRNGARSVKVTAAGAAANARITGASSNHYVIRLALWLDALPTADAEFASLRSTGPNNAILAFDNATDKLCVYEQSNWANRVLGPVLVAQTWTVVDLHVDGSITAQAPTISWKVDGAAQTTFSGTSAVGNFDTGFYIGQATTTGHLADTTYTAYFDDIVISNTSSDYPIADGSTGGTRDAYLNSAGTDGTVTDAGVTTLGPDRLALNFPSINDDNSQSEFSMPTGSYEWLYRTHYAESSGTDGSIGVQTWRPCWTRNQQSTTNSLNAVAYGNGYYVAVGGSGALYYATDPAGTWTSNTQGTSELNAVAYGNGYWVAVGAGGTLYYKASTPDGAWTSNTQGTYRLADVQYGNGYWVAVGGDVTVSEQVLYKASTPDGTWTQNLTAGSSYVTYSCEYGNGYWVVMNSNNGLYYQATNPTSTWTSNTSPGTANEARYLNGYWVTTANPVKYRASDPTSTFSTSSYGMDTTSVAYGNGYYVAAGVSNNIYMATAIDGPWTTYAQTMGGDVRYLNGYFVGVGFAGLIKYVTNPLEPRIVAATIDGGTFTNSDATDGWGCVGFALIGTTKTSLLRPHRYHLIRR